jgi:hypothetical protein
MTEPVRPLEALIAEIKHLPRYWMKIPNVGESQTPVVCVVDVQRVLDAALIAAGLSQQSAGDLYLAKVEAWSEHAEACELDECPECDAMLNQFRLARKVWKSSAHKSVAAGLSEAPKACPHCHLPPVMPDECTPEINAVIEAETARDWELFEAGRQHEAKHRLVKSAGLSEAPAPQEKEPDARAQGDAMAVDFLEKFPDARADRNHLGAWFHSAMQVGAEMVEADAAQQQWQPIETAPPGYADGRFVYVLFRGVSRGRSFDGDVVVSGWMDRNQTPVHSYGYKLTITHWMPKPALASPAPPKEPNP